MEEIWKDIEGYEGLYQISSLGNVKSLNYRNQGFAKNIVPKINNSGRLWVELYKNSAKKQYLIHRLVGIAFIPNPENLPQINHKDEDPRNNSVENLEWCTGRYNVEYTMRMHPEKYPDFNGIELDRPCATRKRVNTTGLAINQFTMDGKFVKQWPNSVTIKHKTGWSDWSISECCRGKRKTAHGFRWQYAS